MKNMDTPPILAFLRWDNISRNGIYTGDSLTYSLTYSQSLKHLQGQGSRPFRQSENVRKDIIAIIPSQPLWPSQLIWPLQPLRPLQTLGPLQLVLALEPILINTTTTANREMYVITSIISMQTIMIITAHAAIKLKWPLQL